MTAIEVAAHPKLDLKIVEATFATPLGDADAPARITHLLADGADAPMQSSDAVRKAVRDMLRVGGFKPTGRSKPASEYLLKAVEKGMLGPINAAVDPANAVSLHSGLPISVVDVSRAVAPYRVETATDGSSYVFNLAGQSIDIGGLLCLFDSEGPCANAVKDSQRTKTDESTREILALVWGSIELPDRATTAADWLVELLGACGAAATRR